MIKKVLLILGFVFLSGCSQLDIKIDYDPEYVFDGKDDYTIVHKSKKGEDTLTQDRVQNAIKTALNAKGYKEVEKHKAELIFVFHTNVQDKSDIQTDYQTMGFGGFGFARGFGGGVVATTSTYNYTEGTLVVDALNPKTQKILWRGIAKDELGSGSYTPEEKTAYINKVVAKLFESFPREPK